MVRFMKIPKINSEDFISLEDISRDEIFRLFEYSKLLKKQVKEKKFC